MRSNDFMFINGQLSGPEVIHKSKHLSQLKGLFEDKHAFQQMSGEQVVYDIDVWRPVPDGTEGGLFFGVTHIYPGTVGDEYFMTHGHFHKVENRGEYYWGIEGKGLLLLMDKEGNTRGEDIKPGSIHYIPGFTAHRVVNTGSEVLRFGACWPADAGHNYASINTTGFSKRVKKVDNKPLLL